ncbi:MAG: hypothetical protein V1874_15635 [Spirochaetota bacterium]
MKYKIILIVLILGGSLAGESKDAYDLIILPEEATSRLTDSVSEGCGICAEKLRNEAFGILNKEIRPGKVLSTSNLCKLVKDNIYKNNEFLSSCKQSSNITSKTTNEKAEELAPVVIYQFHTKSKKLVGISDDDLTDEKFEKIYLQSPAGSKFTGKIQIIKYSYGQGSCFSYNLKENIIRVHCRIMELNKQ